MFLNIEKLIRRKQMTKMKLQPPRDTFFPEYPHQPTHSSSRGDGRRVNPGDCRRQSRPGSRCGCPLGDRGSEGTGPAPSVGAPSVGATLFPPASSRKEECCLLILRTHIHVRESPENSVPLRGDLGLLHCYTSARDRHLRQTSVHR